MQGKPGYRIGKITLSIYGTMMLPIDSMCCRFSGASLNVFYTHVTQVHMKGSGVF